MFTIIVAVPKEDNEDHHCPSSNVRHKCLEAAGLRWANPGLQHAKAVLNAENIKVENSHIQNQRGNCAAAAEKRQMREKAAKAAEARIGQDICFTDIAIENTENCPQERRARSFYAACMRAVARLEESPEEQAKEAPHEEDDMAAYRTQHNKLLMGLIQALGLTAYGSVCFRGGIPRMAALCALKFRESEQSPSETVRSRGLLAYNAESRIIKAAITAEQQLLLDMAEERVKQRNANKVNRNTLAEAAEKRQMRERAAKAAEMRFVYH